MNISPQSYNFLEEFCRNSHGLVAADLKHVVTSLLLSKAELSEWTLNDFEDERNHISAKLKPIKPPRRFSDFYGISTIQRKAKAVVLDPWEKFLAGSRDGLPPRGVLICGPSGVGKTQFGMALSSELGFNQLVVSGTELRSKVVGESEANVARVFAEARRRAPCVLFIDQIDAIAPARVGSGGTQAAAATSEGSGNRIVTSFLTGIFCPVLHLWDSKSSAEMDGVMSIAQGSSSAALVVVVAVTSRLEAIDPAVLRPGRVNEVLQFSLPNESEREEIFSGFLNGMPNNLSVEDFKSLSALTNDCTGANIENFCREAAFVCMRTNFADAKVTPQLPKC
ncbi:hypothetical protein HDU82_004063 [Entophlyctis luteolus]|nr:hypothetical protein HDU82_004063 [Entophlyctis luteolus]